MKEDHSKHTVKADIIQKIESIGNTSVKVTVMVGPKLANTTKNKD